jgi:thioredoxin reductase
MAGGFDLVMADGKTVTTRHVICANGISDHAYIPEILRGLAGAKISHCSEHHILSGFAGKTVAVLGGGASAADYAALLSQAGATTHLITRRPRLDFHLGPHRRGWREKLRYPRSTLGPGWGSLLCARLPLLFHAMPEAKRLAITSAHLGPAPCWFVRDTVETSVSLHTNARITNVTAHNGRAELTIGGATPEIFAVDHIIAATGYKLNLAGLNFLNPVLSSRLQTDPTGAPKLSSWFESTVPGLYFTGTAAANAFGPLLRFACGAEFTASRLSRHFA